MIAFTLFFLFIPLTVSYRCYSCANDFVVWNWRHFFLKRNYGLSSSDNLCGDSEYDPSLSNDCLSSCFILYINGTDKKTGLTQNLGVGKGCSAHFLSDEQYNQHGLGIFSKPTGISNYLSHDFDKYDIHEYWCFCASSRCNNDDCFSKWRYQSYHNHHHYKTGNRRASAPIWSDPYTGFFNSSPPYSILPILLVLQVLFLRQ